MPLYEYQCTDCGKLSEILVMSGSDRKVICPACGSAKMSRQISATSSLTGRSGMSMPGPGDTSCCGSSPAAAGCAGPGSCCGRGPAS